VIPAHATVDGTIDTPGDVTVQGRIEGEIRAAETVTIAAGATCVATVFAKMATIHGELIGNAICTDAIHVGPGARVVGDLRAPDVRIDGAATVDGRVDLLPPEPRGAPLRRLPLTARGPAPIQPAVPAHAVDLDDDFDEPGETDADEPTTERSTETPTAEARFQRRRVPRAPRPRGRVSVSSKREP